MPIHINELTADVTVNDSELSLSSEQLERLAALVAARLGEGASQSLDNVLRIREFVDPRDSPNKVPVSESRR